jgi:hypothetical protein
MGNIVQTLLEFGCAWESLGFRERPIMRIAHWQDWLHLVEVSAGPVRYISDLNIQLLGFEFRYTGELPRPEDNSDVR